VRRLDAAVHEIESALAQSASRFDAQMRAALAATSAAPSIDDVLGAYVMQRQMRPGLDAAHAERFRETAARILARLSLPDGSPLPAELESLAKGHRAGAVGPSARKRWRRSCASPCTTRATHRAVQQKASAEAAQLLEAMPDDAPVPLLRALEAVAAGVSRLDPALRNAAQAVLDSAAIDDEQRDQAAAAFVLQESLRDLGYEVEEIEATLFADGGTVHFRRAGWDQLFHRLRVDPRERRQLQRRARERRRGERGAKATGRARRGSVVRGVPEAPANARSAGPHARREAQARGGEVPVQVVDGKNLPRSSPRTTPTRAGPGRSKLT
jgi:hypothetical protein